MATGRTLQKYARVYIDGYDLSGYARSMGPFPQAYEEIELFAWTDAVKGIQMGLPDFGCGVFNGLMDNTATSGLHVLASAAPGTTRKVLYAQGIRAAPTYGDPASAGLFNQKDYVEVDVSGGQMVTINFDKWDVSQLPALPIVTSGVLLHPNATETAANTSIINVVNNGAATTNGGWCMWQVFAAAAGGATATIKVQDSATNANDASYADVTGLTSGVIAMNPGVSGLAYTAAGATIRQYTRWQITLGTATSVTFALAFMRG